MAGMLPNPAPSTGGSAGTVVNADPATYGWPIKTTDRASAFVPFISDACYSGYGTTAGTSTDNINIVGANNATTLVAAKKTSGHVFGRSLGGISINCTYVDGHVASHKKQVIRCVYIGDSGSGWFY